MSQMEHNKGRLVPTHIDTELFDDDAFEAYSENGYVVMDGEIYSVEWEIKGGELYGFADVSQDRYGNIEFNTYHYNGGAHWTEVVEEALNGNR